MNGLASARRGLTNGLTNGMGFTNGLGAPNFARASRRGRWKLYLIPLLGAFLLLLPLVVTTESLGTVRPIAIDGGFGDWSASSLVDSAANPQINRNIDIVRVGAVENVGFLAFYVEVAGAVLEGGGPSPGTLDTVRIFIDTDASPATGYSVQGLGADRMLEVSGVGGAVEGGRVWEFDELRDHRDWSGWTKPSEVPVAARGSKIEAEIGTLALATDSSPVAATAYAQSWDGETDFAETPVSPTRGTLVLAQESLAPEILSGVNVPILRITAAAARQAVTFDSIGVRILGTASPNSAAVLRLLDRDGALLGARIPATGDVRFSFPAQTVAVGTAVPFTIVGDFPGGTGATFGVRIPSPLSVGTPNGIVAIRTVPAPRFGGYVGALPLAPRVDGGFSEWTAVSPDPTGEPGLWGNADIDLKGYGAIHAGGSLFLYADVAGRILAGTPMPQPPRIASPRGVNAGPDRDRDTVPDAADPLPSDFDNDGLPDAQTNGDVDGDGLTEYGLATGTDVWLNTTIPASFPAPYAGKIVSVYIGPTTRPVVVGEDVMRVFLDVDNSTSSGFAIAGVGADRMVEIRGEGGAVTQSALLSFMGSFPGEWRWNPLSPVTAASGYHEIELTVEFSASAVYLEIGDFWGGRDSTAPVGAPLSSALPRISGAPNPPRILDISGNAVYYLLDTNHATEAPAACTTNKVAATSGRTAPVNTITLSTGQSACWYLDATTGTTISAGDWESLLDVSLSSTYSAKAAAFNIGTGGAGTTVPVTGVGFQPKVVLFWWSGRTTSTDSAGTADHQRGFGVAVSTTDRRAVCSQSQNAQSNAVSDAGHRADAAICSLTTAGAWDGLADLSSMDANGFTLIIDDAFATDLRIHYIALGGSSLTNAATGMFTESSATGNQDITTVGFQPDGVILFSAMHPIDPPASEVDAQLMVGFAAGAGNPSDVVWAGASDNAATTTQTISYHRAGESIAIFDAAVTLTNARGEVDAWLSNGFSLNWNEASTAGRRIHYLALKGGSYAVGDLLTLTTSGTIAESGFGFSPKASLFLSHNKAQSTADTVQAHDEMSIGAFSSTTDRGAQCVIDEDAVPDSDVGTAVEHDEVYCNLSTATAIEGKMGIQTVGSGGFTLVMDDPDPVASFVGYIAFGADVDYEVYLEIWDKTADSVRATIGSCLGVTAAGDDRQCLVSGVLSQTIASNEVVRIRVVHSGSAGTVSIDYDDTDATGDSRVTIPIPEFGALAVPFLSLFLVAFRVVRRHRSARRSGLIAWSPANAATLVGGWSRLRVVPSDRDRADRLHFLDELLGGACRGAPP